MNFQGDSGVTPDPAPRQVGGNAGVFGPMFQDHRGWNSTQILRPAWLVGTQGFLALCSKTIEAGRYALYCSETGTSDTLDGETHKLNIKHSGTLEQQRLASQPGTQGAGGFSKHLKCESWYYDIQLEESLNLKRNGSVDVQSNQGNSAK